MPFFGLYIVLLHEELCKVKRFFAKKKKKKFADLFLEVEKPSVEMGNGGFLNCFI